MAELAALAEVDSAAPPAHALRPGAQITFPGSTLVVVDVGTRLHSMGFGHVDFTALVKRDSGWNMPPGTIVNTPLGQGEVVAMPVCPNISQSVPARAATSNQEQRGLVSGVLSPASVDISQ